MAAPPTWRALTARARRSGLRLEHGRHVGALTRHASHLVTITSWIGEGDSIILRTAIAAALEQLEARR